MVKLIACVDSKFGISKAGQIPWSFKKDLEFFRKQTLNQTVVMGRKTWLTLPNLFLDKRVNCVLSRSSDKYIESEKHIRNLEFFSELETALEKYPEAWIIGGAEIYNYALESKLVDYALITFVKRNFGADIFLQKKHLKSFRKNVILEKEEYAIFEYSKF